MVEFPSTLDDKEQILRLLGGFWNYTYEGQDLLAEAIKARWNLTKQTFERLQEASDCRSRLNIPVFRKENWRYFSISSKEITNFSNMYGEGGSYDDGSIFGLRSGSLPFICSFPKEIADCKVITNRITNSSMTLLGGLDFFINKSNSTIRFAINPFNDPRIQKQKTDDGYEEVILWLYKPQIDKQYLFYHFGNVINMWAKSSEEYKELVNNVYDSLCDGTSIGKTLDAVSITTGIPLAKGTETVEYVEEDKLNKLVITDKFVYGFSKHSQILVSVGDTVSQDQSLSDGFIYQELNRGVPLEDISVLSVSSEILNQKTIGDLGFINSDKPISVTKSLDGKTVVTFEVGGHPFDVDNFWKQVNDRGIKTGKTLADYLDTRNNKDGEPQASNLPESLNPLLFMCENLFRYGGIVIKINSKAVRATAAGIDKLSYVRRLLPPHSHVFIILSLPGIEEVVNLYEDESGYSPTTFTAANTLETELNQTFTQEVISGRVVSGGCT